ncbi:uncharacterized protein LOC126697743 isoform X2 [Quercus robur]|uniref:uncharacterized protein LOC126697743 isoform X2 n=1 Tax=Quercus robur TaxID=38942 RepID=UPI0021610D3C|nr:uncharacterized protein LOC126697743 isoform X2 [Quercus robur]
MFAKLFTKSPSQKKQQQQQQQQSQSQSQSQSQPQSPEQNAVQGGVTRADLDPRLTLHYGIPSTASILAFDSVQSLLAIGTLDGRIKVIGGDNIEALLISPKQLPYKYLEFLQNQGFIVSISTENEIQVWDLEHRQIASTLQWESNITAFSVIYGTTYMYIGCEYGMVAVLKYDAESKQIIHLPYCVPKNVIAEASGISLPDHLSVVGVLHQPLSQGNRLLIAYDNGLIVLWDASEDRIVLVRGYKDLLLKDKTVVDCLTDTRHELSDDVSDDTELDKEISSICWASNSGLVLAVGYVDGDIMFWNLSNATSIQDQKAAKSSNDVVKLQLSSGSRRLPVIVLHWATNRSHNDCGGQLFVYGGDEIGSEEVLTILSLDWSAGIESLKCIGRVDLTLNGFADMVLLPSSGTTESGGTGMSLVVLTNPGKLNVYNDIYLSALVSQKEKKSSVTAVEYPMFIPTLDPYMTVAKLGLVYRDGKFSKVLSEIVSAAKLHAAQTPDVGATKWPLTGGVPCQLLDTEVYHVERIYIAGYQDGSVRVWDATYPALSLIYVLGEVNGINIAGTSAAVSALDFCSYTLTLAIGNQCGLVCVYKLVMSTDETSLHFVTETVNEVHNIHQEDGPHCTAVFSLLNSPVCTLQFADFGSRLAVGFESGRVAVLDTSTLSVLFFTDSVSDSNTPVISLAVKTFLETNSLVNSPEDSESKSSNNLGKGLVFTMTRNAHIVVMDSATGNIVTSQSLHLKTDSIAISMYILDGSNFIPEMSSKKQSLNSPQKSEARSDFVQTNLQSGSTHEVELDSNETVYYVQQSMNLFILLCCEDALFLYSFESVIKGESNSIWKVNLVKPCCWTATFKKNEKELGLVVLYQSGAIEIRSLPTLEVLEEISLMSILRWNFKTNMDKTMCSSDNGQIFLVNGCEFATVSLLGSENDFRIPESLPSLHDKILEAAVPASVNLSPNQKNRQDVAHGVLGGIIKNIKVGKEEHNVDADLAEVHKNNVEHLESLYSSPPFLKPSTAVMDDQDIMELNIDDIKIDEPIALSSPSPKSDNERRDKGTERERLFEGASTDTNPRPRTAEEIRAKYRKAGDASAAASQARDKLAERKEKLERISQRTEELQSGAENFASMASELAKTMERRKWWNI